jgi:glutathione peroxidase
MMKNFKLSNNLKSYKSILINSLICLTTWNCTSKFVKKEELSKQNPTIYTFSVKDISGKKYDLAQLKGKKILIVNTASKCGLTPQYKELEKLYQTYKDKNFIILGFPSNDFGSQEPGTNDEISSFCSVNYGVSFPMMEKIYVKGENQYELYQFLTKKELNKVLESSVSWNFQKYLINENGQLEAMIPSTVSPTDKKIIDWIESNE